MSQLQKDIFEKSYFLQDTKCCHYSIVSQDI